MGPTVPLHVFPDGYYIQQGVSPAPGVVIVTGTIGDDFYDSPHTQILVMRGATVTRFDCAGVVGVSIDASSDGRAYVLDQDTGTVIGFDWRAGSDEALHASRRVMANPAVEAIGPLRTIRILGPDVVCAGTGGQVYRLDGDTFVALPPLRVGGEGLFIEEMTGTGIHDLIMATLDRVIAAFDGRQWRVLDLPAEASGEGATFSGICTVGPGRQDVLLGRRVPKRRLRRLPGRNRRGRRTGAPAAPAARPWSV